MLQKIFDIFQNKEKKDALKKLQSMGKKIPLITLPEERQNFEQEKRKLRDKLYGDTPIKEIVIAIDELSRRVESYLRVQQDEDYLCIIELLARKDIGSEAEIVEIYDNSDREIVFKYLQVRKEEVIRGMLKTLNEKLSLVEQMLRRTRGVISQEKDAEELRRNWSYILQEEQDTLDGLKNRCNNLKDRISNLKYSELVTIEHEVSDLIEHLECLEKYGQDYLSEQALEEFTNEVKNYIPRGDITYKDTYKGLGDSIVTELKNCIDREYDGKVIKEIAATLIHDRLKKKMFLRQI